MEGFAPIFKRYGAKEKIKEIANDPLQFGANTMIAEVQTATCDIQKKLCARKKNIINLLPVIAPYHKCQLRTTGDILLRMKSALEQHTK